MLTDEEGQANERLSDVLRVTGVECKKPGYKRGSVARTSRLISRGPVGCV